MTHPAEIRFRGGMWRIEAEDIGCVPHVRTWAYYSNADGELRAQRSGLQLPVKNADWFIDAVSIAADRRS